MKRLLCFGGSCGLVLVVRIVVFGGCVLGCLEVVFRSVWGKR